MSKFGLISSSIEFAIPVAVVAPPKQLLSVKWGDGKDELYSQLKKGFEPIFPIFFAVDGKGVIYIDDTILREKHQRIQAFENNIYKKSIPNSAGVLVQEMLIDAIYYFDATQKHAFFGMNKDTNERALKMVDKVAATKTGRFKP